MSQKLNLSDDEWITTFQSRFGPREWLTPYTDITLKSLAQEGIKHVNVICPGFSADCLETLEEIRLQNRDFFIEEGGQHFGYVPALNDNADHIKVLSEIILQHAQGWPEFSSDWNREKTTKVLQETEARALALKGSGS